jgi:hypothetical protein
MYVDVTNVVGQPLIYSVYKLTSVLGIVAVHRVAPSKFRHGFKKFHVGIFVSLGHGATVFLHASFLEAEVATAVEIEGVEQHAVDRSTLIFVEGSPEVVSHLEDHFVILVDTLNASRVIVAPLHSQLPTSVQMLTTTQR